MLKYTLTLKCFAQRRLSSYRKVRTLINGGSPDMLRVENRTLVKGPRVRSFFSPALLRGAHGLPPVRRHFALLQVMAGGLERRATCSGPCLRHSLSHLERVTEPHLTFLPSKGSDCPSSHQIQRKIVFVCRGVKMGVRCGFRSFLWELKEAKSPRKLALTFSPVYLAPRELR